MFAIADGSRAGIAFVAEERPTYRPEGPKLLDRVRAAIRTRHLSPRTEEAYVFWIRRYIVFHGKRHPATLGQDEVTQFLSDLAVARRVSASTLRSPCATSSSSSSLCSCAVARATAAN